MPISKRMRDSTSPLRFTITKKHAKDAVCRDPQKCVVAVAVREALPDHVSEIHVGSKITKVVDTHGLVIRYGTPQKLAKALRWFDTSGLWDLPEGDYHLNPPSADKRLGAWKALKRKKGKKPTAKKRKGGFLLWAGKRIPTRHVTRVESIARGARA